MSNEFECWIGRDANGTIDFFIKEPTWNDKWRCWEGISVFAREGDMPGYALGEHQKRKVRIVDVE